MFRASPALRAGLAVLAAAAAIVLAGCSVTAAGAANRESPSASNTPRTEHVVVIGDSITAGHGLAPDQAWPVLLARKRGWALTNLGTDGAGFSAPGTSGETFDDQISDAADLHPDLVILSGSDNDIGQSQDLASLISSMLTKLRSLLPDAHIVATSAIGPAYSADQLRDIDAGVKSAIAKIHGVYLDIGDPISGRSDLLQSDGEHPTAAGQQVIEKAIDTALTTAHVLG